MPRFTTVNDVACGRDDVFAYIVDLARWTSFPGWGPLPGIVEATLPDGQRMGLGARVRVRNTDGSVHHEIVRAFEPGRRYAVRMELSPPASRVMACIDEDVELADAPSGGTRVTRTFVVAPRSPATAPLAWLVTHVLLRRAVLRHDRAVERELAGAPPR